MAKSVTCPNCDKKLRIPDSMRGNTVRCPGCQEKLKLPRRRKSQKNSRAKESESDDDFLGMLDEAASHEQDAASAGARRSRRGTYHDPWEEYIDVGSKMMTRLIVAGVVGSFMLMLFGLPVLTEPKRAPILILLIPVFAVLALCTGTFLRVAVECNDRGKKSIKLTRRIAFIPVNTRELSPVRYDTVVIDMQSSASAWVYILMLVMCFSGAVPGIIFWYVALNGQTYSLELKQSASKKRIRIYAGTSDNTMRDIADFLQKTGGLNVERDAA